MSKTAVLTHNGYTCGPNRQKLSSSHTVLIQRLMQTDMPLQYKQSEHKLSIQVSLYVLYFFVVLNQMNFLYNKQFWYYFESQFDVKLNISYEIKKKHIFISRIQKSGMHTLFVLFNGI